MTQSPGTATCFSTLPCLFSVNSPHHPCARYHSAAASQTVSQVLSMSHYKLKHMLKSDCGGGCGPQVSSLVKLGEMAGARVWLDSSCSGGSAV